MPMLSSCVVYFVVISEGGFSQAKALQQCLVAKLWQQTPYCSKATVRRHVWFGLPVPHR